MYVCMYVYYVYYVCMYIIAFPMNIAVNSALLRCKCQFFFSTTTIVDKEVAIPSDNSAGSIPPADIVKSSSPVSDLPVG